MTPLAKARQLLESIQSAAETDEWADVKMPKLAYAQIGTPVISCECFTVGVLNLATSLAGEDFGGIVCDAPQMATFVIILAYDCSWTADAQGNDIPAKVAEASEHLDLAGEFLWDWVQNYVPHVSKQWSLTWVLTGGLGLTTMTLTTGVD